MPELAGVNLADASGNRLTDGSAAYLVEQSIAVTVDSMGVLHAGTLPPANTEWTDVPDWIDLAVELIEEMGIGPQIQNLTNGVDMLLYNWKKLTDVSEPSQPTYHGSANWQGFNITDILDRIDNIPPPEVEWPAEAPTWYVVPPEIDTDLIASAVWGYTYTMPDMLLVDDGPMMETMLGYIHQYLQFLGGYVGLPVPDRAHFNLISKDPWSTTTAIGYWTNLASSDWLPQLDLSLVQSGDTVWTYLTREYDTYTWLQDGPWDWPTGNRIYIQQGTSQAYGVCTLTDADIRNWWPPESDPPPTVNIAGDLPPVWPGLANVTVGSSAALSDALVVEGPMEGLLFTIDSANANKGKYGFGSVNSWQHVGAVIFCTDRGDYERAQSFSIDTEVVCPRTMKQADSAIIRFNGGFTGTVRPWTKTT